MPLPSGKPVKAKKIGGSLIAAFPGANPPVVWKFDLEKNHSFTMALQGEDGDWELGVTSPRGEFYPVARFLAREDADDAFACAQKAMLKREYNIWRIVGPICLILLILLLSASFYEAAMHRSVATRLGALSSSITPMGTSGQMPPVE